MDSRKRLWMGSRLVLIVRPRTGRRKPPAPMVAVIRYWLSEAPIIALPDDFLKFPDPCIRNGRARAFLLPDHSGDPPACAIPAELEVIDVTCVDRAAGSAPHHRHAAD